MALVLNDRVKETTTTTGTGTVNLAGAEIGFESFVAGIGNSNTCYYTIAHQSANEFEVGLGTVTDASPDTLSRTTIISSSNSDSAVNFSAGTKDVFCTLPASKAVFVDGSGDLEFNAPGDDFSFKNSSNTIAFIKTTNNDFIIQNNLNDKDFILKGYDSDGGGLKTGLTIDYSDGATAIFGGKIQANDAIKFNSNTGTPEFQFLGSGTETGVINLGSSNFTIESKVSDKDIIFKGVDGGSDITALTLDMSDNGNAIFNGTVNAGLKFIVNAWNADAGGRNRFYFANGATTYFGTGSTYAFRNASDVDVFIVDGSGNGYFDGNVTAYYSDERLKDKQGKIENALDKVGQIETFYFTENELAKSLGQTEDKKQVGVSAQSVKEVLPEIVDLAPFDTDVETGESKSGEDYMTVDYAKLTPLLIEAIKEQQEQIEALTAKVKELEDK
jgi:hypothetical protein